MKKINIPKFFHELFGTEQYKFEVVLVFFFTIVSTFTVGYVTKDYWMDYNFLQVLVLLFLFIDIAGGVIANLSKGTDLHYHNHKKGRMIFIAIHVQPLILSLVMASDMKIAIGVWAYTMVSVLIVNYLHKSEVQRTVAGTLLTTGLIGLYLLGSTLPKAIFIIYMMYLVKVIFSFGVYHRSSEVLNE